MADNSYINLSGIMMNLKKFDVAISDLSNAIKRNPKWGDAYYHMG
jgi:hypothetical protein